MDCDAARVRPRPGRYRLSDSRLYVWKVEIGAAGRGVFVRGPCVRGQFILTKAQRIGYTADSPYERFPDGGPRFRTNSYRRSLRCRDAKGFPNQFAGDWKTLNPGKRLVGAGFHRSVHAHVAGCRRGDAG